MVMDGGKKKKEDKTRKRERKRKESVRIDAKAIRSGFEECWRFGNDCRVVYLGEGPLDLNHPFRLRRQSCRSEQRHEEGGGRVRNEEGERRRSRRAESEDEELNEDEVN